MGLEKWKHSSNYYKPYNGGRVVIWVASDGTIKTSVTMMPPNAKSLADSASLTNGTAKANASIANNTFYPTFEAHTSSIDEDNLSEEAKTFRFDEFGNGSANQGTGGSHYADASMLDSNNADDIYYEMADGLTTLCGTVKHDIASNQDLYPSATNKTLFITFIGTGFSYYDEGAEEKWKPLVQNLPYGTHVFAYKRLSTMTASTLKIDGIQITTGDLRFKEFTFFQPKKPPVPEDACILADYMLMADFVPTTATVNEGAGQSKGVRYCVGTSDAYFDSAAGLTGNNFGWQTSYHGWIAYNNNNDSEFRTTAFGTAFGQHFLAESNKPANTKARLDGADFTYNTSNIYDTNGEWDDTNDDATVSKHNGS